MKGMMKYYTIIILMTILNSCNHYVNNDSTLNFKVTKSGEDFIIAESANKEATDLLLKDKKKDVSLMLSDYKNDDVYWANVAYGKDDENLALVHVKKDVLAILYKVFPTRIEKVLLKDKYGKFRELDLKSEKDARWNLFINKYLNDVN